MCIRDRDDCLANVPFVEGCGLWFDHHSSEFERLELEGKYKGESRLAPSCARIIYEYYGGNERFSHFNEMMEAVDKVDSGHLTIDEIQNPKGWILIGFLMDPRTGLGRWRNFTISNYQLMERLIDACRTCLLYTSPCDPPLFWSVWHDRGAGAGVHSLYCFWSHFSGSGNGARPLHSQHGRRGFGHGRYDRRFFNEHISRLPVRMASSLRYDGSRRCDGYWAGGNLSGVRGILHCEKEETFAPVWKGWYLSLQNDSEGRAFSLRTHIFT